MSRSRKETSKKHVSASVPVSRFLPQVPSLDSFDGL